MNTTRDNGLTDERIRAWVEKTCGGAKSVAIDADKHPEPYQLVARLIRETRKTKRGRRK